MRMPYQATPKLPAMPISEKSRMIRIFENSRPVSQK